MSINSLVFCVQLRMCDILKDFVLFPVVLLGTKPQSISVKPHVKTKQFNSAKWQSNKNRFSPKSNTNFSVRFVALKCYICSALWATDPTLFWLNSTFKFA
jgi:hypothetical protein